MIYMQNIAIMTAKSATYLGNVGPNVEGIAMLTLLGAIGTVAYTLVSRAYQIASASVIAPFDYSYLPLAAILAYLLWGEVPPHTTFIGMVLIIVSGMYTAYRELRVNRSADDNPPTAQTVFAPGAPSYGIGGRVGC